VHVEDIVPVKGIPQGGAVLARNPRARISCCFDTIGQLLSELTPITNAINEVHQ
jgi:hypothetical protein